MKGSKLCSNSFRPKFDFRRKFFSNSDEVFAFCICSLPFWVDNKEFSKGKFEIFSPSGKRKKNIILNPFFIFFLHHSNLKTQNTMQGFTSKCIAVSGVDWIASQFFFFGFTKILIQK
jgi:hypothetical protein